MSKQTSSINISICRARSNGIPLMLADLKHKDHFTYYYTAEFLQG